VLEQGGQYWVTKRGDGRAVRVDAVTLRTTVELTRSKLIKKATTPAAAGSTAGLPTAATAAPGEGSER
jgi:hypothetical protein